MQIIAGIFKGRKLKVPDKEITRPTRQKNRDAVFKSIKSNYGGFEICLDLFAGSGAFGIEAISRGIAKKAVFIEKSIKTFYYLKTNLKSLDLKDKTEIVIGDAVKLGKLSNDCGLIFLDPPYGKGLVEKTLKEITKNGWKKKENLFIAEMDEKDELTPPDNFKLLDEKKYGRSKFLFLKYTA